MMAEARSNFEGTQSFLQPEGAEACSLAIGDGGKKIHFCNWRFAYRDGRARAFFRTLDEEISTCLGEGAETIEDLPVNHPDFFLLRSHRKNPRSAA